MGEEERLAVMRERRSIKKSNHETFALRMDLLYKLSAANHLRSNFFWLPSNIDFRGRAYPIPPHGCHMGMLFLFASVDFDSKLGVCLSVSP